MRQRRDTSRADKRKRQAADCAAAAAPLTPAQDAPGDCTVCFAPPGAAGYITGPCGNLLCDCATQHSGAQALTTAQDSWQIMCPCKQPQCSTSTEDLLCMSRHPEAAGSPATVQQLVGDAVAKDMASAQAAREAQPDAAAERAAQDATPVARVLAANTGVFTMRKSAQGAHRGGPTTTPAQP